MNNNVALELKNVTKTFGSVIANKNVNLTLKKGEILLAKALAQKHYYGIIRPILAKKLNELKRFVKKFAASAAIAVFFKIFCLL